MTVGGADCPLISVNFTIIHCTLPAKKPSSPDSAEVIVTSPFGDLKSPQYFYYSQPSTPIVSEISPLSSTVWGGDTLNIVGTKLKPPGNSYMRFISLH